MMTIKTGQRKEDKSFWFKFDYYVTKYKLIVWVFGVAAAAGFGLKLPIWTANQTQAKIDSSAAKLQLEINDIKNDHRSLQPQIRAVRDDMISIKDDLNIQLRLSCADKYTTQHDKYVSGLKCDK